MEQIKYLPSVLLRTWFAAGAGSTAQLTEVDTAKCCWVLIIRSSSHKRKLAYRPISAPQQWHLQQALGHRNVPMCYGRHDVAGVSQHLGLFQPTSPSAAPFCLPLAMDLL